MGTGIFVTCFFTHSVQALALQLALEFIFTPDLASDRGSPGRLPEPGMFFVLQLRQGSLSLVRGESCGHRKNKLQTHHLQ